MRKSEIARLENVLFLEAGLRRLAKSRIIYKNYSLRALAFSVFPFLAAIFGVVAIIFPF